MAGASSAGACTGGAGSIGAVLSGGSAGWEGSSGRDDKAALEGGAGDASVSGGRETGLDGAEGPEQAASSTAASRKAHRRFIVFTRFHSLSLFSHFITISTKIQPIAPKRQDVFFVG